MMGVYHRYMMFRYMTMMHYHPYHHDPYYSNYYSQGRCYQGCPYNSHCNYGFCECNLGFQEIYGSCYRNGQEPPPRHLENPFIPCDASLEESPCQSIDLNMVCYEGQETCDCRQGFKWNPDVNACQLSEINNCMTWKKMEEICIFKLVQKEK